MRDHFDDPNFPPPWTWELVIYHMNLENGSFIQFPYEGNWRDNYKWLDLMRWTYTIWRHCQQVKAGGTWTPQMVQLEGLLDEWRNGRPQAPSNFELWIKNEREHAKV
ncbi:MAG: hypothetical protein CUN56_00200 [Phototrophicales bacterium]|nr:MAG: hypothetical protein CUN56_00200 [Phototrophicales bacterium]